MLIAKNLVALVLVATGVCNAATTSSSKKNLRIADRDLYGYDSPYTESVAIQESGKNKDSEKIKGTSSSGDYNYGYSTGSSIGGSAYPKYKGSYSSSEDSAQLRPGGRTKNTKKNAAPVITRKPRPYKKPSNWNGDGHKPSKKPTPAPVEPVVTPEPTDYWKDDGFVVTPQPTDWKDDGFEPVVTPQPTDYWKDDGFEPVVTPQPTDYWKDDGFEPVVTPDPTPNPTRRPTRRPSNKPTRRPSNKPTKYPTPEPTLTWKDDGFEPVVTLQPTDWKDDGFEPVVTPQPTDYWKDDGFITSDPTLDPTRRPTRRPSNKPTRRPSNKPTRRPSNKPTKYPTPMPTKKPTKMPTRRPSNKPTENPTPKPTPAPIEPVTTPEPTMWNGDGHSTSAPTEYEPVETDEPTPNPTQRPSFRPTKKKQYPKPVSPPPTTYNVTPEPTVYYDYTPEPTMLDPIENPSSGSSNNSSPENSFPGFSGGHTGNSFPGFPENETIPGSQWRKEVDEQCEQITIDNVCVDRCVVVTSIFQGGTLLDESSRVTQSSCLNKRQEAKQNQ